MFGLITFEITSLVLYVLFLKHLKNKEAAYMILMFGLVWTLIFNTSIALTQSSGSDYVPSLSNTVWLWYLGRTSGVAAFVLYSISVCLGLLMTTKLTLRYRLTSNQAVLKTHSVTTSIIGFSALLIHIGSLYLGQLVFLSPSILGTPIFPGIAAFGICTVLILTSHYRGRIVKMKLWRLIHYSSFLFYVLMSVHAVMSGTDSANPLIRLVYIVSFLLVGTLMVARFLGPKTFVSPIDRT